MSYKDNPDYLKTEQGKRESFYNGLGFKTGDRVEAPLAKDKQETVKNYHEMFEKDPEKKAKGPRVKPSTYDYNSIRYPLIKAGKLIFQQRLMTIHKKAIKERPELNHMSLEGFLNVRNYEEAVEIAPGQWVSPEVARMKNQGILSEYLPSQIHTLEQHNDEPSESTS